MRVQPESFGNKLLNLKIINSSDRRITIRIYTHCADFTILLFVDYAFVPSFWKGQLHTHTHTHTHTQSRAHLR